MYQSSLSDGSGWWQVDLGGVYNLSTVIIFNRYPFTSPTTTGSTLGAALNGARLVFLNYNGDTIGANTLSGTMVQTIVVATYPPTASATATSSASRTASASNSFGITPSATALPTPSVTTSPSALSNNPIQAKVFTSAASQCLNFVELFVFDINGRNLGASAAGASVSLSSQYGTNAAQYGADLLADPNVAEATGAFVNAGCTAPSDYYTVNFPPTSNPTAISTIFFVNRLNGGLLNSRIVNSGGQVLLFSAAGPLNLISDRAITSSGTISTFVYASAVAVPTPSPSDPAQLSVDNIAQGTRFVYIAAAPGNCLTFREIFVFDRTYANVALLKSTTSSALTASSTSAMGVNNVIDFDNTSPSSDMVSTSACDGSGWWSVDLGGIYNLSSIVLFNNFPLTAANLTIGAAYGARLSGATVSLLNAGKAVVGTWTLNGTMVQTFSVRS